MALKNVCFIRIEGLHERKQAKWVNTCNTYAFIHTYNVRNVIDRREKRVILYYFFK
jgi:hypothetical protein